MIWSGIYIILVKIETTDEVRIGHFFASSLICGLIRQKRLLWALPLLAIRSAVGKI